ncbi:unnamed protein product [Adineta ricciae]|uniref:Discoidin domain-containing receptor 2 n=1 Tax=Adineta ricciae TaxID=249248 RepID=A0A815I5W1_ADIRI|nr:unnamed protein product [Adineta ricciae]
MMEKFTWLFILLSTISYTIQFNLETCRYPLGIENGKILDSAFSSSSHASEETRASKARIRSDNDGWCPENKISSTTNEYIQIDLVNLTVITLVELQGKFSQKSNEHYADAFRVEYRRNSEQQWIRYKDFSEQYVLGGNSNSYIPTIRDILPAIIARQIRIIPMVNGLQPRYICMRLELYGCVYEDGLTSYSIPQGDKRGFSAQFFDETYDGENDNGTLKDGLGQLTDGIFAHDDYHLADLIQGQDQSGCDWIGWKRKSPAMSNIKLTFHFDTIRNFSSMRIHTSNLFTHDIYQFYSITVTYCDDMNYHQMYFVIPNDYINTSARFIQVSFAEEKDVLSDCLNIILTFNSRSKWILISEVQFDSVPIYFNQTQTIMDIVHPKPIPIDEKVTIIHYWHWLFLAFSLLILLIVTLVCVYIHWMHAYRHHWKLSNITKFHSKYRTMPPIGCCISNTTPSCTSTISNNDICQQLIVSTPESARSMQSSVCSPMTMSSIYQSNIDSYLTAISTDAAMTTPNPYFTIEMYTNVASDSANNTHMLPKSIQGPCGNSTYEHLPSVNDSSSTSIIPYVNEDQVIVEQIHSPINGSFGSIFRGYLSAQDSNNNTLKAILIKILTTDNIDEKILFDQEHELLSSLHHPNLVQFYGYTTEQNYAIIEHSDLGDLYTYLFTSHDISKNIRLYIITQLSNALCYLESHGIIHRDIATRNCLIYSNFEIKLTNTAIVSEQFQSHYYRINQISLPIRWMPPECILHNQFTSQSDIWSFGITLWEVMSNCSSLPYSLLNDEEVYQRLKTCHGLQLSKPECLSKELIDLMLECWRPWNERPTFQEIYNFFNKRLYGMNIS